MILRRWLALRRQAQTRGPRLWQAGRRGELREQGLTLPQARPLAVRPVRPLALGLQLALALALALALELELELELELQPAQGLHLKLGLAQALELQPEPEPAQHLKLGPALGQELQPALQPAQEPALVLQPALGLVQVQVRERPLEQPQERVQVVVQSSLWGWPPARC
jgi:hypothetical protein